MRSAAATNDSAKAKALLAAGADPNEQVGGFTLLQQAVRHGGHFSRRCLG